MTHYANLKRDTEILSLIYDHGKAPKEVAVILGLSSVWIVYKVLKKNPRPPQPTMSLPETRPCGCGKEIPWKNRTCEDCQKNNRADYNDLDRVRLKNLCRWKTGAAIKSGELKRGPCEVCGTEKVQAHHADYSKHLEVRWLCIRHHAQLHFEMRQKRPITNLPKQK